MSTPTSEPRYRRVLLKISGEALAGAGETGIDPATLNDVAAEIVSAHNLGVQTAVVVGGGNIIRGGIFSEKGQIDRTSADQMGMMGTVINALALQSAIERLGVAVRVQSAIAVNQVAESFIKRRAVRHLEKGRVVVFAAGTGNPFFSTDTASALRALEIGADVLIKATKVDGIYDKDPRKHDDAVRYSTVGYTEVLAKRLAVMDQTAFTLCRENSMPIIVLDLNQEGSIRQALMGEPVGTLVDGE
ncbi:MAG: UMP kinase [Chthonomonas sp.]|nr:UMP kinase [Chthonomonas sp.]